MAWAKMATPTFRDETDYQFVKGVGVKMAYGVAKMFRKYTRVDPTGVPLLLLRLPGRTI